MKHLALKDFSHFAFGAAAMVITGLGWLLYTANVQTKESTRLVTHTLQVIQSLDVLNEGLNQAEFSQYSYLISADAAFLPEREQALAKIGDTVIAINKITTDDNAQQQRIAGLNKLIATRVAIMQQNTRQLQSEVNVPSKARTTDGQKTVALIFALSGEMKREE